ncbi:ABC transporter permease [Paenibacillus sp. SI8]|uniref:ABC transporter permease n=1 Tax=unclassified Paenibacillus TaxID=185978 RepID=UPI00346738C0
MKRKRSIPRMIILAAMVYLLIPLLATLLYSIAGNWQASLLPDSWTLHWFGDLFRDIRFLNALGRTLYVCLLSVAVSVIVMLPTIFVVTMYFPKWERWLNLIALIPYAIPGVVAAVGLIKLYSSGFLAISGTVWILIAAYFVAILPYMYQGIRNSIRTVNALELMEAAELLGASKMTAFRRIIVPNIMPGILVSTLLSISVLFGEFVLTNLLIGGHFETIQIYLYRRLSESGHLASAIVIAYFVCILLLSGGLLSLSKRLFSRANPVEWETAKKGA